MAFGISCNFSCIQSYAQAVKAWQAAVIFPKDRKLDNQWAPRGLVDTRKKHMTIEKTAAADIILRLYDHPVVTWHKDNSLTLRAFCTRSTTMFATHCTPAGMYVSLCGGFFAASIDGRTYKVKDKITFHQRDNTWKADQITPWSVPVVNRERAKQALREVGYEEFRLWFQVYVQMAAKPDGQAAWIDNHSMVIMLRERKWRDLLACRFPNSWSHPDRVLYEIRQTIYRECGCIEHKSVPFLG
jgi:hypothetical protein